MSNKLQVLGTIAAIIAMLAAFNLFGPSPRAQQMAQIVPYSELVQLVDKGSYKRAMIRGQSISLIGSSGTSVSSIVPSSTMLGGLSERLMQKGVTVEAAAADEAPEAASVLINWLPSLIFLVALWFIVGRPISRAAIAMEARTEAILRALNDRQGRP